MTDDTAEEFRRLLASTEEDLLDLIGLRIEKAWLRTGPAAEVVY
jgi:hypothetical protein